jgi:hypothetical protein
MTADIATRDGDAIATPILTANEELLSGITSFADAMQVLQEAGIEPTILGDGFYPLDKESLVGVAFVVLGAKVVNGDYGDMTVMHVVTENPIRNEKGEEVAKGLIVDGSSGIHSQMENYIRVGKVQGLICRKGLVKSTYFYDEDSGQVVEAGTKGAKPATTYYLS